MKHALFGVLLLAIGCHHGAPAPAAPANPGSAAVAEPHGEHDEHANLPPELAKFHELLAPRWHAEKGAARTKDTCAAVGDFAASADALAKLAPPAGADAGKWAASTQDLVAAVGGLKTSCEGAVDDAKFEDAFHTVHVGFHHVLEASGAGGEEHHEGAEHPAGGEHHDHEM